MQKTMERLAVDLLTAETKSDVREVADELLKLSRTSTPRERAIGYVKFSDKETARMPTAFRRSFMANGSYIYRDEAGYRLEYKKDGYNIASKGMSIDYAKESFLGAVNVMFGE